MQKCQKNPVCGNRGKPPCEKRTFASCISSIRQKWKKIYKNMRTTIIEVKFDEKSKSEVKGKRAKESQKMQKAVGKS